jgi:hypothetical protein
MACQDVPTKPNALVGVLSSSASLSSVASSDVTTPLIDDASGRLSAAIEDQIIRERVRELLGALSSALANGNAPSAHTQIARLRKIIDESAKASDGANLAALGLALDQIELQLNGDATPNP